MATSRPVWVVTRATEMPPARARALPVPKSLITWKVSIMPSTVPSRPSSGATAASTPMASWRISS